MEISKVSTYSILHTSFPLHPSVYTKTCNLKFWFKSLTLAKSEDLLENILLLLQMFHFNPSHPDSGRPDKISLNFYFHASLRCLKRFYEGLKPFEAPQRNVNENIWVNFYFNTTLRNAWGREVNKTRRIVYLRSKSVSFFKNKYETLISSFALIEVNIIFTAQAWWNLVLSMDSKFYFKMFSFISFTYKTRPRIFIKTWIIE